MKKKTKDKLDIILFILGIIAMALLIYGIIRVLLVASFGLMVSIFIHLRNIKR